MSEIPSSNPTLVPPPHEAGEPWLTKWSWLIRWMVIIAIGLPSFDAIREATEPSLGRWGSFFAGLLGCSIVGLPALWATGYILGRDRGGRPADLAAMVYRPAILPLMFVYGVLIKQIQDRGLSQWSIWILPLWFLIVLAFAVVAQRGGGRAWSWKGAVFGWSLLMMVIIGLGAAGTLYFVSPAEL